MEKFYVTVKNSEWVDVEIEVSEEIYSIFDEERKYDERIKKRQQRHIHNKEYEDDKDNYYSVKRRNSIEESVLFNEFKNEVDELLKKCSSYQKRRFEYYCKNYTLEEISDIEGCSKTAVKYSLDRVRKKIQKLLK